MRVHLAMVSWMVLVGCVDADPGNLGGGPIGGGGGGDAGGSPHSNEPPIAQFDIVLGAAGSTTEATLDASASSDSDGVVLSHAWTFPDGSDEGVVVERSFPVGCHEIELVVTDNDGATDAANAVLAIAAGPPDPDVAPSVSFELAPLVSAVIPRDVATDEGIARFRGIVATNGYTAIRADVYDGDTLRSTVTVPLCEAAPVDFTLDVPIPSELTAFDVHVSVAAGDMAHEVLVVTDLVAGDIYVVQGQSNAAANQQAGDANVNQGLFVRSFGTKTDDGAVSAADRTWRIAEGNTSAGPAGVGQWPIRMAAVLSARYEVPIGILNGSRGGMPIAHFQRNDADPADPATNYGRLLTRATNAAVESSLRAILWYQGESDGADFQTHRDGFVALKADWAEDLPGIERLYVTQLRPGCGGDLLATQEVQRKLADDFPEISVMSTTGLDGHDGCHYTYADGYEVLGDHYAALLGRDLYGEPPALDVQPPNPASARFAGGGTQIIVKMRNPDSALSFEDGAEDDFRLEGSNVSIASAAALGPELILTLSGNGSGASGLSYLGRIGAGPWVLNESGVGLLEFDTLPIDPE